MRGALYCSVCDYLKSDSASAFRYQSSAGRTIDPIPTEFLWTLVLLCCWPDDVKLTAEIFA